MVKKKKEIEQKEDLQEPQEIMDDNEPKSEETTKEDSEIVEGMVMCKSCKKDIEPYPVDHNRWRCPECNKYTRSPDMKGKEIDNLKEVKPSKDRPYEILSSRNIKFSGNELAQAEMLIQSGVASNFNDLAKKAFNILFLKEKVNKAFGIDRNIMETNQEPNPERTMKQIQEQEMMKGYIESMKKGSQDPIMTMMMMRMMDNQNKGKDAGDNGFMKELMQMQMMKMFSGGDNQQANALQREIADLKQNMQVAQLMNQQQQTKQGTQMSQDYIAKMEKIKADRDTEMKKIELEAQEQRDKNMQYVFETKVGEIQKEMQRVTEDAKRKGEKADLSSFRDQLNMVKELSVLVGDKEKGTGEMIMESLGSVAEKVAPALIQLGQQKQQQQMMPQQIPPQAEQLPPGQNPQELPPEQPKPEPNPHGLTPTEQEMSNTMSDMYIHKKDKKKE